MYLWIKAFHIISVISWMAVLFYLPRLFVYHVENKDKKEFLSVVKIMEYKLYKYIGVPAFWGTVLTGVGMIALNPDIFKSGGWIHLKLTVALLLIAYFFHLSVIRKRLERDICEKSGKFFRMYNEVPTVLMIIIVIMAVVKPF
ncbi:putative membrane protein [Persephonella hydrogeniphila]|uniref:Protoporphyrinogen IX oxidase n=1 Tax=Persephonella hydrogeniphila TaxID=198703 RepID=A0A285NML2_9AQUI|nr:protoporphyrinogen oxidase HemJ [Persephonella hydrogeniphila]SNZ10197.1 putative membrane protein [Persephonella hydrogeniphila]